MPRVVVSLTTYPKRIATIAPVLKSLLSQTVLPSKIVLWLAKEEFPDGTEKLPLAVKSLLNSSVLEIDWCDNYYSYKKLIPALKKYPDALLITVDDDIVYQSDLIEKLLVAYVRMPTAIHAMRVHVITGRGAHVFPYGKWISCSEVVGITGDNFPTSGGGTLYPPGSLDQRVCDVGMALQLCPRQDDVWFWAMAVLRGTKINGVAGGSWELNVVDGSQSTNLYYDNLQCGGNDDALKKVFGAFPALRLRLPLSHYPFPSLRICFSRWFCAARERGRSYTVRILLPIFQMKYNVDYSILTYKVLCIPVWRRHCRRG